MAFTTQKFVVENENNANQNPQADRKNVAVGDEDEVKYDHGKFSSIYTSYKILFYVMGFMGLHVIGRDEYGKFYVGKLHITCALVFLLNSAFGLSIYIWIFSKGQPYWYVIIILPTAMNFIYLSVIYIFVLLRRKKMVSYMEALSVIKVKRSRNFYFVHCCFVLIASLVAIPMYLLLPSELRPISVEPVLMSACNSMLQDIYVANFMWCLVAGYQNLEEDVRQKTRWTEASVVQVSAKWLNLKKLLAQHNEVNLL